MDVMKAVRCVQDEAECPICLQFLKEPMILECGHNFCNACITQCWEGAQGNVSCPQCKQTFTTALLRPNRKLANLLGLIKQFRLREVELVKAGRLCELHDKSVTHFCKTDQEYMCSVCDASKAHRGHVVVPLEEAAQEYKNEIHSLMEMRKRERRQLLQCSSDLGGQRQTLVQLTEDGNEKMTQEYKQFCQSMKGLQDDLMELAEQMKFDLDLKLAMLGEEESCAAKLINEMEKKCEQPACEFLQDIKQTLRRYEAEVFKAPEAFSAELKRKLWDLSLRSLFLQDTLKKCSEILQLKPRMEREHLTFDPATVHPPLVLSKNRKNMEHGPQSAHSITSFHALDSVPCVFSCEGFTSGRHYWEVEIISGDGSWTVGVAKESVKKKDVILIQADEGIWALQPESFQQLCSTGGNRIRVCLDYEREWVAFFDANTCKLIATLPAAFAGDKVVAFFMLLKVGTQIKLLS